MGNVRDLLDGFELVLSRLWTIGFLLISLGMGVLIAPRFKLALPSMVREWAGVVLLVGIAAIATSAAISIVTLVRSVGALISNSITEKAARRRDGQAAIANLVTLSETEIVMLLDVLSSSQKRFELPAGSSGITLVQKKICSIVAQVGGSALALPRSYMVELTPEIAAMSVVLRARLLAEVKGNPFRFGGIGHRYITAEDLSAMPLGGGGAVPS